MIRVRDIGDIRSDTGFVKLNYRPALVLSNDADELLEQVFDVYPNPVVDQMTLEYSIIEAGDASLKLYNTIGQELDVLMEEPKNRGKHSLRWDASNLPTGIYLIRLRSGGQDVSLRFMKR